MKERLYRHNFTGAQHQLVGLRNPALEQESLALLRASATLSARIDGTVDNRQLVVRVTNVGAGHALPTGVADFREIWLELTVTDANGNIVLTSGQPVNGAVPEDARLFRKVFGDAEGKPVDSSSGATPSSLKILAFRPMAGAMKPGRCRRMPKGPSRPISDSISAPTPSGSVMRCAPPSRTCRRHP